MLAAVERMLSVTPVTGPKTPATLNRRNALWMGDPDLTLRAATVPEFVVVLTESTCASASGGIGDVAPRTLFTGLCFGF